MTNDGEKRTQKNDATFQWLTHQCLSSDDINMRLYGQRREKKDIMNNIYSFHIF